MNILLGSNAHFRVREYDIAHINEIGTKKSNVFFRFFNQVISKMRKCIRDESAWKNQFTDMTDKLKGKYAEEATHYNLTVDNYALGLKITENEKAIIMPMVNKWVEEMKKQRTALLDTLEAAKTNYQFKSHGFFYDRLSEVKKIAHLQEKELTIKNLDRSFANFLAEQISATCSLAYRTYNTGSLDQNRFINHADSIERELKKLKMVTKKNPSQENIGNLILLFQKSYILLKDVIVLCNIKVTNSWFRATWLKVSSPDYKDPNFNENTSKDDLIILIQECKILKNDFTKLEAGLEAIKDHETEVTFVIPEIPTRTLTYSDTSQWTKENKEKIILRLAAMEDKLSKM